MAMGRPKSELILSEAEQAQLSSIARSRTRSSSNLEPSASQRLVCPCDLTRRIAHGLALRHHRVQQREPVRRDFAALDGGTHAAVRFAVVPAIA